MFEKLKSMFEEVFRRFGLSLFCSYIIGRISEIDDKAIKEAIDRMDTDIISKLSPEEKITIMNLANRVKKYAPDLYKYIVDDVLTNPDFILDVMKKNKDTRAIAYAISIHPNGKTWLINVLENIRKFLNGEYEEVKVIEDEEEIKTEEAEAILSTAILPVEVGEFVERQSDRSQPTGIRDVDKREAAGEEAGETS